MLTTITTSHFVFNGETADPEIYNIGEKILAKHNALGMH